MRYSLTVQYIGKNYGGSQIQTRQETPTIQKELEKALCTLIIRCEAGVGSRKRNEQGRTQRNRRCERSESEENAAICDCTGGDNINTRPIKTVFSGRTDAGVNSVGQVVHFETEKTFVASKFIYALNEILPDDISVSNLREVEKSFHAQKSAKKRHYQYIFINRKYKYAFDGDLMRVKHPINIERIQKALDYLKGEHDFSAFKNSGTLNPSDVCFIYETTCKKVDDKVVIDIIGNRFLYSMVRNIVGTVLHIEGHNLEAEHIISVLNSKDRSNAGKTVSPYGLTLLEVTY